MCLSLSLCYVLALQLPFPEEVLYADPERKVCGTRERFHDSEDFSNSDLLDPCYLGGNKNIKNLYFRRLIMHLAYTMA
jgi:hypothetical protein